ncbi:MAG: DUF4115 domain-containing protein [Marinosulfonomonas sp.]|nr:DUF4115 domain-containing protein [Marinosulfonomonas sp.]
MIGRRQPPPVEEKAKPKGFDDFELRLGDVMRGERATMGKSLLDVQRDLKIKATYISAIENADPSAFDTQGFIAGYVRSYARYLGLDPEWAYSRFCEEGAFATSHGMAPEASARHNVVVKSPTSAVRDPFKEPTAAFIPAGEGLFSRVEPTAVGSTLVVALLIGVVGYGGWSLFQEVQKVQFAPVDQSPGVTSQVDVLQANASVVAAAGENSGFQIPTADALDRLYRPEALDIPVLVARDGPIATLDPAIGGALAGTMELPELVAAAQIDAPEQPVAPVNPVQVVAAGALEVKLFAVRPSWVRVRAGDGTVLFEKILDAGEQYILPNSAEPPMLRAGNAGSLYFSVGGKTYGPVGAGPSVVKNVVLSHDAVVSGYSVADLSKDNDLARFVAVAEASQ